MIDRPNAGERAILVQLALPGIDADLALAEFKELALSAQAVVVASVQGMRATPEAKYFVGLGKAEEIHAQVLAHQAELVLVNHDLSPSQERNLERLLQCRVVGRSGLILDIFAQRARTFEGKLQVELAQLEHLSTRLVRGWTHLERQKGGIGLRGPGETQLETDRRLLRDRIKYINHRLEKVRKGRDQNRRARQRSGLPTIALVGYTNAGKSSLFNSLTDGHSFVANKLFATLDPTMRRLALPGATPVILADTVGFIRDLPHQLIEAFRATLEETQQANLLLHVIDVSEPDWRDTANAVLEVLREISADEIPLIRVFNKIDLKEGWVAKIDKQAKPCKVWLSSHTGEGIPLLLETLAEELQGIALEEEIYLPPEKAQLRAKLYQINAVIEDNINPDGGWNMKIKLTEAEKKKLFAISK